MGGRWDWSRAHGLWHKAGVLAEAVARSFDLHDHGVVQQSVEQCGCDHMVAEHLTPFGEAAIAGEDHGAALVTCVDQLEEQIARPGADRQIANLVDDQQRCPAQEPDTLAERALAFGPGQRGDDVGERREVDAAPGADGLDTEGDREVGLAGAGWPEQVQHLVAPDEIQLCQTSCTRARMRLRSSEG